MEAVLNDTPKEKKFANGFCFYKFFWIFIIGCFFGCLWEEALGIVTHFLDTGNIVWTFHRALIYGPFNPVYGCGAVFLSLIFGDKDLKWWQYILYGALAGGCFEYFASFFQEKVFGTVSWDYSNMPLNINGRTNIPYMIFWGLLACIWAMYVFPKLSSFVEAWPTKTGTIITNIFIVIIIFDILLTFAVALRKTSRNEGISPSWFGEAIIDKYYDDDYIAKYFGDKSFIIVNLHK